MDEVRITRLPKTQDYIKGVINLRGDIIPVVSVRRRFGLEEKDYDDYTCVIVIDYNDCNIGLIVDNVIEVKYLGEDTIAPPPNAKLGFANQFIRNLGITEERVILLLDIQKLLYDE